MKGRLHLDVVIAESVTVLELFSSEDQKLMLWGDTFPVLDQSLYVLNSVRWLDFNWNCLVPQSLYEDLHTATEMLMLATAS